MQSSSGINSVQTRVTNAECYRQVCVRVCMCLGVYVCVFVCLQLYSAVPLRDKALGVLHRDDIISLG